MKYKHITGLAHYVSHSLMSGRTTSTMIMYPGVYAMATANPQGGNHPLDIASYQRAVFLSAARAKIHRRDHVQVRLYCIDTPELKQAPWGKAARDSLRQLVDRDREGQPKHRGI